MKKEYCDICGAEVKQHNKVGITGSIANLSGAESVCPKCYISIRKIDWESVVKRAIMENMKIEKPMMPEVMVIDCETPNC